VYARRVWNTFDYFLNAFWRSGTCGNVISNLGESPLGDILKLRQYIKIRPQIPQNNLLWLFICCESRYFIRGVSFVPTGELCWFPGINSVLQY